MIFIDENIPSLAEALSNCGEIKRFVGRELTNSELKENHCEFLFVRSTTKIKRSLLHGTDVKFVATATSGIDHIDTNYLKQNNIFFADAKGSNANSVAEYVVYSVLKWSVKQNILLENKIIGIIGYGSIGKIVASYFYDMGFKVIVNDPPLMDEGFNFPCEYEYLELDDLLQESDIVTNHVPFTFDGSHPTVKLINSDNIDLMKSGSLMIHASRGGVIDEVELIRKIDSDELTLVVDVFENEPLINMELARKAIHISPHVAGYAYDGKLKGTLDMLNAFEKFTGLEPEKNRVISILDNKKSIEIDDYSETLRLYKHLAETRDFDSDSDKLLDSLNLPEDLRAIEFDRQRKEYPKRRESIIYKHTKI